MKDIQREISVPFFHLLCDLFKPVGVHLDEKGRQDMMLKARKILFSSNLLNTTFPPFVEVDGDLLCREMADLRCCFAPQEMACILRKDLDALLKRRLTVRFNFLDMDSQQERRTVFVLKDGMKEVEEKALFFQLAKKMQLRIVQIHGGELFFADDEERARIAKLKEQERIEREKNESGK